MYSEQHPVTRFGRGQPHPMGLHYGSLTPLKRIPIVQVNGMAPTEENERNLWGLGRGGGEVTVSADSGDPQTDRDLVHLARGVINYERDPWYGQPEGEQIPPEAINQWANLVRAVPHFGLNMPQEGAQQLPPEAIQTYTQRMASVAKSDAGEPVTGEMSQATAAVDEPSVWNGPPTKGDNKTCPKCDGILQPNIGYDACPHCGHLLKTAASDDGVTGGPIGTGVTSDPGTENEYAALGGPIGDSLVEVDSQDGDLFDEGGEMGGEGFTPPKQSKWQVVSLGEMQQPGGVGATQGADEVSPDGEDAFGDQPPFTDNAQNSFEQEVGLQTWVNYAVDLMNRGEPDEAILAKLAHDGCPNPEEVLQMAQQQPMQEKPVSDEIGQDPFEAPAPDDGTAGGQMESLSQQPPVMAATAAKNEDEEEDDWVAEDEKTHKKWEKGSRVRIAGSSLTGTEIDRYEDTWGEGIVIIALDDGGTRQVSPNAVEAIDEETPEHPVTQIQQFIDTIPPVEPTRPSIEARVANLEIVRRACRDNISKVGFSDQVKLASIDSDAQEEILALKESLGAVASESDMAYLSGQQTYRPHGLTLPGVEPAVKQSKKFNRRIAEHAAIFVAELPEAIALDESATAYAAARYAQAHNGDVPEFVRLAEEHRVVRTEEFAAPEAVAETTDNEGPAESLFL